MLIHKKTILFALIITTFQSTQTMEPVEAPDSMLITIEKGSAIRSAINRYLGDLLYEKLSDAVKLKRLKELLATNPSERAVNRALECAFSTQNKSAAKLLINHGADPNFLKIEDNNYFPLWNAAARGWTDICALLLEKNACVNAQMEHSQPREVSPRTALGIAALHGRASVIELLLAHKADCTVTENKNRTLLHLAAYGIKQAYIHNPNPKDFALYLQDRDYEKTCNLLIAHGIDKNALDVAGQTAYDYYPMLEILKPNIK